MSKGTTRLPQRLCVATRNRHKTQEIAAILGEDWEVRDLTACADIPEIEETGATFAENATIKALAVSTRVNDWVLADDSGLEVDALDGAPGVRSARYAGEQADDAPNRAKLLQALKAVGARGKTRSARFRCALVLAHGENVMICVEGKVEGMLIPQERGAGGFGYDPLFIPEGYCETFAQLAAGVKNQISHRARALQALLLAIEAL